MCPGVRSRGREWVELSSKRRTVRLTGKTGQAGAVSSMQKHAGTNTQTRFRSVCRRELQSGPTGLGHSPIRQTFVAKGTAAPLPASCPEASDAFRKSQSSGSQIRCTSPSLLLTCKHTTMTYSSAVGLRRNPPQPTLKNSQAAQDIPQPEQSHICHQ